MKYRTRHLLSIIPILPLLMAVSTAEIDNGDYQSFELTFIKEESLHGYNFYSFNLKNVGDGYIDYFYIQNNPNESSFNATLENDEIYPPFLYGVIEPGFDKNVVFVTKNTIPSSHNVVGKAYAYSTIAEEVSFSGSKEVSYSLELSDKASSLYAYNIDVSFSGLSSDYDYSAAIKLTYEGETYCVKCNDIRNDFYITANTELNLSNLTIDEVVPLKSKQRYYYDGLFINLGDALRTFLIFFIILGLFISFGIFAAIFFPAMARRKRRNRMNAANK